MIPASRATARVSPLGTPAPRSSATTSAETSTRPDAVAERVVTSLADTSTIRAAPDSSMWVSRPVGHRSSGLLQHQHLDGLPRLDRRRRPRAPRSGSWPRPGHRPGASPAPPTGATYGPARRPRPRRDGTAGDPPATTATSVSRARDRRDGVRLLAHQLAQRGQHEDLEGDVGRHRVARQREDRDPVLADPAEALRLAGLHRDRAEPHALGRQRRLDHVVVALRDAAGGDDDVGADQLVVQRLEERGRLVGDDADPVGDRAGAADRGGEQEGVAVVDRVVAELGARARAARSRSRGSRPAAAAGRSTVARPTEASSPSRRGPRMAPCSTSRSPTATSSPAGRMCWCGSGAWLDPDGVGAAVGPLVGHHRVGALRHRRAGHDLGGRARTERAQAAPGRRRSRRRPAASPASPARRPRRRRTGRRTRPSRSCRSSAARSARRRPRRTRGRARRAAAAGPPPSARGRRGSPGGARRRSGGPASAIGHQGSRRR